MASKTYFILSFLFLIKLTFSHSQGIEDQRKYGVKNIDSFEVSLMKNPTIGGITLLHHSDDFYYDLYLDSPDFILNRNGFSLRFRKRISNENGISYSFQLKSEMLQVNGIRMEVEESDLYFYKLLQDTSVVNLTELIDPLFDFSETKTLTVEIQKSLETLKQWLIFKSNAPILPFQQLKFLNDALFNDATIGSFIPVLIGKSKRSRFHGVIDPEHSDSLHKATIRNQIAFNELPIKLQENIRLNWIFEASLDKSQFFPIEQNPRTIELLEFEVENKFFISERGAELIDKFQKEAEINYNLTPVTKSKYAQAIEILHN
ncbi:MAG: hypothetical protein ACK50Y_11995 [Flavobacteriia bacterium]|jgi:hypothetical protein